VIENEDEKATMKCEKQEDCFCNRYNDNPFVNVNIFKGLSKKKQWSIYAKRSRD